MCQLQASLKGVEYKLAAYRRENEKLADGAEAAKAELTGECSSNFKNLSRHILRDVCCGAGWCTSVMWGTQEGSVNRARNIRPLELVAHIIAQLDMFKHGCRLAARTGGEGDRKAAAPDDVR